MADFKKFDYSNVDKVVTEIEAVIKKASNTIYSSDEIMSSIGKDEKVMTGNLANEIASDWKKSKAGFEDFVSEFRKLINQKYEEAGAAHRKFEGN